MNNYIKTVCAAAFFLFVFQNAFAQVSKDTIVTKKNEKIIGKIIKVTDTDIEYRKGDEIDAPVYVISKDKVREMRFANGTIEKIAFDEMDVNKEIAILDKRSAVKLHFFSPMWHYLEFGYERCIKVGTNIEASVGYIDNYAFNLTNTRNVTSYSSTPHIQGAEFRFGPKFLFGQDFYVKGMKYAHPLKGHYFKPEVIFTSYTVQGLESTYGYNYPYTPIYSNLKINAVTLMINYGRQIILGNILTFGYSVGCGYAFVSSKYTNSLFNNGDATGNSYAYNLYTHLTAVNPPIAIAGTVTLGYIFK